MTTLLNRATGIRRAGAALVLALVLLAGVLPTGGVARAAPEPVDLNSAPLELILALPVPADLAKRIYERRVFERYYASVYELMDIDGMTAEIFAQIKPLVSTIPPAKTDEAMARLSASFNQVQNFLNEEGASEGLADEYLDRLRSPMDVNEMDLYDLMSYQNVSPVDATAILKARSSLGRIEDERQLRGVDGLRYFSYRGLRNFLVYSPEEVTPDEVSGYFQARYVETPHAGLNDEVSDFRPLYPVGRYYVDQEPRFRPGVMTKLRLRHRDGVQGGFLTTREYGEVKLDETFKAYVGVTDRRIGNFRLKSLIAGDFRAAYGLGLVMDNTDYLKYRKTGYGFDTRMLGIHGDLSRSYEYNLRGAAVEGSYGPADLSFFVSSKDRDGILNPDGTVNRYVIMRPRPTEEWLDGPQRAGGLARDAFHENTIGGNLKIGLATGTYFGVSGYEARYDRGFVADESQLVANPELIEARDSEIGSGYTSVFTDADGNVETHKFRRVLGAEAQTVFANVALQGEYAFMQDPRNPVFDSDNPDAYVINAFSQWDNLHLLAIYRDYDVGFDNPYSRAFSNDGRYEMTLLDSDFRLVDNHYAWLVSGTPQPKAEKGLFLDMRYRFSRNLILSGLQFDQWTRKADGADMMRYTIKGEYQPIFNLRLGVRHRYSSRSESDAYDVRAYQNWETRWTANFLLSGNNRLLFTYMNANVMFPPRARLGGTALPGATGPSVGTAGSPSHAFETRYEHTLAPGLVLTLGSCMYDGFFWNFEGNEFVLLDGKSFRNWLNIESRISDRVLCQLKVTRDHNLPQDIDVRRFGEAYYNDPDATQAPNDITTVRLQMDYTF
jgi:DNA uptake protein ComE-like DNA-binding protein